MRLGVNARFLQAPVGGVQRFARELTGRLIGAGDVVLFTPRGAVVPAAWADNVRVVRGRLAGYAWEQLELPAAAAASCDVLLNPANIGPVRAHPRQVLMLHDIFPLTNPEWYGRAFATAYRALIPAVARRAALILTTSQSSARVLEAVLRIEAQRIRVVPQGVAPFDAPASTAQSQRVLASLGVQSPYVLVLGAGDTRKNTAFAEAVLERLRQDHGAEPALVLIGAAPRRVYGSAPRRGYGSAPRREHGTAPGHKHGIASYGGRVVVLGRVADVTLHALYTGAAALLSPALAEGFGRAPLEALCCGTPCLAATYPAAREVLRDTPAQCLPLDVTAWADALAVILRRGERVDATVREGLRRRWSWDAATHAVLDACGSVCAPAVAAPAGGVL